MAHLPRIVNVQHLGARVLRVRFDDGLSRDLDFAGTLDGVLANIDNDESFGRVSVDEVSGTISWPGGLDLDPDVLHGDHPSASGGAPTVLKEHWLQASR